MQFLVIAYDGHDPAALERRLAVRERHLALADQMTRVGQMLYATAILDEADKMIGSMLVVNFPSRTELDAWLGVEPYMTGNVWQRVHVQRCRVAPQFAATSS